MAQTYYTKPGRNSWASCASNDTSEVFADYKPECDTEGRARRTAQG